MVAEGEDHKITFDKLVTGDLAGLTVTNDSRLLLGNEAHLIDGFFGTYFVDNTNKSVCDSNEDKKEIFIRANIDNHEGKDKIDKIKDGKSIAENNLRDGVLVFTGGGINFTMFDFI